MKAIFGLRKVSFDEPGESFEQDTLFVEIEESRSRITQGKEIARVTGQIVCYSQRNKLPYGFFSKRIEKASAALTSPFFFYDMDREVLNSPARAINLTERRCSFLFLYSAQYDPNQGHLEAVDFGDEQDVFQVLDANGEDERILRV